MATTYDVGLKWVGGPEAQRALADAAAIRASLGALEAKKTTVGTRGGGAEREQAAQMRMQAQAVRSIQQAEAQKRNAAYRRLQQSQREEEAFVRYRIALDRRLVREKERAEQAMLRAELQRIRAAQRAEAQAARAHERSVKMSQQTGKSGSGSALLGMVGGLSAGGLAVAAGAYVGGQAVDTVQLIESARMRLTASLGSTEAANKEIKDAFRIAEKTIFDPRQMVDAMAQLSTNFKALDMRRYVLGAISDFATVSGKGEEGMKSAIIAINQIVAKGKLQQEELTGQLGELGLPARKVYDQLAVILKVKGKDDQARTDKVIKMITDGKVGSDAAVQAITQVMRNQAGGGAAGSFAKQNASSLEGQISNLKSGFSSLFAMNDIEKWPAMERLKDILGEISGLFATDSKAGADFMSVLKFWSSIVIDSFTLMAKAILLPTRALYFLVDTVRTTISEYNFQGLFDIGAWSRLGQSIVLGLVQGIKSAPSTIYDAVSGVADTAINTVKAKLGIASPSRVMMQLGGFTGEGFARGIEGGAGRVSAASRMLGDAAAGGVQAGGGVTVSAHNQAKSERNAAAYSIQLNVEMPIQSSGGDPEALAAAAGPMIGAKIEMELGRYFGRLAAQGV